MSFYTSNAPIQYTENTQQNNKSEPKSIVSKFYQICTFQNPGTGKYHTRKFIINNVGEFAGVKEYKLSRTQYTKLLEVKKTNQYKCYSTYDLKNIAYPSKADVLTLTSSLLAQDNDYCGFAPF